MPKPIRNPDPVATAAEYVIESAPLPSAHARKLFTEFPNSRDPAIIPCWMWKRTRTKDHRPGKNGGGFPHLLIRPDKPAHPLWYAWGRDARVRRICANIGCVNPYHHIRIPRPPSQPKLPTVMHAEGALEELKYPPPTPSAAIQALAEHFDPEVVLQAYRNLKEDKVL